MAKIELIYGAYKIRIIGTVEISGDESLPGKLKIKRLARLNRVSRLYCILSQV